MLDACNEMPSLDSYQNDSLVLLNWYDEAVRLYGISEDENTAMLLYVQGEKLLIDKPYRNNHISYPKLNVTDADNDGHDEIFISRETMTGSPGHWYELLVCDYEDEWIIRDYTDYVEDLEAYIGYKFDETSKTFTFMRNDDDTVLLEASMPDWTEEYPYTGDVNYADYIRFDAETMQMEVSPGICMENSLPAPATGFLDYVISFPRNQARKYEFIQSLFRHRRNNNGIVKFLYKNIDKNPHYM